VPSFLILVARDLSLARAGLARLLFPVLFFVLVAAIFPFAVGPEPALLARIAGGVTWTSALLASLLPVEQLIEPDRADGSLDQLVARGLAPEWIAGARMLSHWLAFAPLILAAALVASVLLGLQPERLGLLLAGLLVGTPALAVLGVVAAALTAGLHGSGALVGILVLPLALPTLIFGAGSLAAADGWAAIRLLGAASLVLAAVGPFAAGAGLRAAAE
jgi:heme exporter protein B